MSAFKEVRLAQRTGKPVPQVLPIAAEAAAAQPVDQAAPTGATPPAASEPAKPKKNADTRIQELLAERDRERSEVARLRAELETRRTPDVKVESSPAKPTARDFERFKSMPGYPQVNDFDDYGDYTTEVSAFVTAKRLEEYSQKQKQEYDAGQFREAQSRFDTRGTEAFPDFREVLTAAAQAGRTWPEHVTRKVLTHDQGHAIAYALAKAKDDAALYQRIADPVDFGEYVGEVLAQRAPVKSPVPIKTSAPEPPITLGERSHDSADEEEAAIASGDMSAFKAARLAKRVAMTTHR